MMVQPLLGKLWALMRDRKTRGYVLLPLLVLMLVLVVWIEISTWPTPDPQGATLWLKCSACDFYGEVFVPGSVADINCVCPKCKAKLGYLRKCRKCSYEYIDIPKPMVFPRDATKEQKFEQLEDSRKCPNCGSTDNDIINEPPH